VVRTISARMATQKEKRVYEASSNLKVEAVDTSVSRRGLRIGELARLLGTTTKTLRYYEELGLLGRAKRSESAYRLYDDEAVEAARLVIGLRHLDLGLPELEQLLQAGAKSTRRKRLLALLDEKLRAMYVELGVLQGKIDDLAARHSALLATPRERPLHCVCDALLRPCSCSPIPIKKQA